MAVYLVRHGQTDWNQARRFQSRSDVPLNSIGRAQALAIRRVFEQRGVQFTLAKCSPLSRAMATARILLEGTLTPLTLEPRFIEIDLGDFEGQLEEDLRTKLGSKYDDWRRQNYAVAPPNGGENIFDVVERVRGALCSIRRAAVEGEVLIVGHQVSNMAMKIAMSGRFEPDKADMLRQNNDEVEVWDFAQGVRIEQFKIVVAASKGRV